MTPPQFDGVTVKTQANVYFNGKCISYSIVLSDGTQKTVGVILPSTPNFHTGAPEVMECVAGHCDYRLAGSDVWQASWPGEKFSVPGNTSFDIRVQDGAEPDHYICHLGHLG